MCLDFPDFMAVREKKKGGEKAAKRRPGEKAAKRAAREQGATREVAPEQEGATKGGGKAALPADALERLVTIRRENLIDADQPMVLIAQAPRSGGTLLSQLVDGHPELHAHPGELKLGPAWPSLDLADSPQAMWKSLQPKNLFHAFRDGYSKDRPAQKLGHHEQLQQFPFMLPPSLYRDLFLDIAAERTIESQRDALDVHFTALFNAWLDNQNLYGGPKRWIAAFRGRLRTPENLAKFFQDYPEGRHITCVREPRAKLASKLVYVAGRGGEGAADADPDTDDPDAEEQEAGDLPRRIRSWRSATELQIQTKERYGDQVFLLTFENLVTETERTMRAMAEWLEIEFDPILTQPTFNRFPIKANSSYKVGGHGVRREPLENWRSVFSEEEAKTIEDETRDLRERVAEFDASSA